MRLGPHLHSCRIGLPAPLKFGLQQRSSLAEQVYEVPGLPCSGGPWSLLLQAVLSGNNCKNVRDPSSHLIPPSWISHAGPVDLASFSSKTGFQRIPRFRAGLLNPSATIDVSIEIWWWCYWINPKKQIVHGGLWEQKFRNRISFAYSMSNRKLLPAPTDSSWVCVWFVCTCPRPGGSQVYFRWCRGSF